MMKIILFLCFLLTPSFGAPGCPSEQRDFCSDNGYDRCVRVTASNPPTTNPDGSPVTSAPDTNTPRFKCKCSGTRFSFMIPTNMDDPDFAPPDECTYSSQSTDWFGRNFGSVWGWITANISWIMLAMLIYVVLTVRWLYRVQCIKNSYNPGFHVADYMPSFLAGPHVVPRKSV